MPDYKMLAAQRAHQFIESGQIIGLGDGSTVLHLVDLIAANSDLAASLSFTSSSAKTLSKLQLLGIPVQPLSELKTVDIYFDGCDQFDSELNALKSGGGIHTFEKILAFMAREFILIGDADKYSEKLTTKYPLLVEILPEALSSVVAVFESAFPDGECKLRQNINTSELVISGHGNYLLEVRFTELPELALLNTFVKMLPGVVNHSLFYRMAKKAIVSGPGGTKIMAPIP